MTIWADGWAVTRNRPSPRVTDYGRYIHVGLPKQDARHVINERANAYITELSTSIVTPWTFIKTFGSPTAISALLPDDWVIGPAVWLMTSTFAYHPLRDAMPPNYGATILRERVLSVELRDRAGEIGATGRAAIVGGWCVFDQIETAENHRRRGLGTEVMRLLSQEASLQGAERGLLVATDDGRALYRRLGWLLNGAVTSALPSNTQADYDFSSKPSGLNRRFDF